MFKNIESRGMIRSTRKWPHITFRLVFYYSLSATFFILFYYLGYENFGYILKIKPNIANWAGIRIVSLH
jgi:hypothetical protein